MKIMSLQELKYIVRIRWQSSSESLEKTLQRSVNEADRHRRATENAVNAKIGIV